MDVKPKRGLPLLGDDGELLEPIIVEKPKRGTKNGLPITQLAVIAFFIIGMAIGLAINWLSQSSTTVSQSPNECRNGDCVHPSATVAPTTSDDPFKNAIDNSPFVLIFNAMTQLLAPSLMVMFALGTAITIWGAFSKPEGK